MSAIKIINLGKLGRDMRLNKIIGVFSLLLIIILSVFVFADESIFETGKKLELNEKSLAEIFGKNVKHVDFNEVDDDMDEIISEFENNERLDVIIWLKNNEFTSSDYQEDLDKKREEIRRMQDIALEVLGDEFDLKYKYIITNGFAGSIKKMGFEKLIENDLIDSVYLDGTVYLNLAESRPLINATAVEQLGYGGQGVTVCVIDTGVDYTHPDLGGCLGPGCKVVMGYDFCNGPSCAGGVDPDPMDESSNGHGTHVAGIIASSNLTYRGVAPNANIAAIKVFSNAVPSTNHSAITSGIDFCVNYAQPFNIKVITMSLGDHVAYTPQNCPTVYNNAIQNAVLSGIFVDAASGNDNLIGGVSSPACAPNVVSVGSVYDASLSILSQLSLPCVYPGAEADIISCFTNRGNNLDLLAPGALITSTLPGNNFGNLGGTSMAAPHVAGLAALMYQVNPSLSAVDVESIMKSTGKPIFDSQTGLTFPRINARKAFANAGSPENWIFDKRLTFNDSNSLNPSIAVDSNGNVHVVWQDNRDGNNEIYYKKLNNLGESLTGDIRLTFNPANSEKPKIDVDSNGNVHVVWEDYAYGNPEIFYKKLNNNGLTMSPDIRVTSNSDYDWKPTLGIDSLSNVHIAWQRGSGSFGSGQIYYKKLNNLGIPLTSDILVGGNSYTADPSITIGLNNNIHVVWSHNPSPSTIGYRKLDNLGGYLTPVMDIASGNQQNQITPKIVAGADGLLRLTWLRSTYISGCCYHEIAFKILNNNGTVLTPDISIDNLGWNQFTSFDTALDSASQLTVSYKQENPSNQPELYFVKLNASGSTITPRTRLTYDLASSSYADIAVDSNNNAHIVWEENRDGNNEIYYKRSFTPIKMIGTPNVGNAVTFKLSDPNNPNRVYGSALSLGTSPGIPLSDGRVLPLNYDGAFYYSVYYPAQIGLSNTFGLLNNNGNGDVYWTIPNNPAIAGMNVSIGFISVDTSNPNSPEQIEYISSPFTFTIS